jgi:hypothetical protein
MRCHKHAAKDKGDGYGQFSRDSPQPGNGCNRARSCTAAVGDATNTGSIATLTKLNRMICERLQGRLNQKQRTKRGITGPASEHASALLAALSRGQGYCTVQQVDYDGIRTTLKGKCTARSHHGRPRHSLRFTASLSRRPQP